MASDLICRQNLTYIGDIDRMAKAEKITLRMIFDSHPESKIQKDKCKSFVHYFLRPISFPFGYVFLNLGISANSTTNLSILVEIVGCALLAFGGYKTRIAGVLLILLWAILDCVDGEIARFRKTGSSLGSFLDDLGAIILYALLYLSVGITISINSDGLLYPLIIGALSSIFAILRWVVNFHYKITLASSNKKYEKFFSSDNSGTSFAKYFYVNSSTFGGFVLPLLLIFTVSGTLHIFNIIYLGINLLVFATVLFVCLKRLISFENCS